MVSLYVIVIVFCAAILTLVIGLAKKNNYFKACAAIIFVLGIIMSAMLLIVIGGH